MKPLIHFAGILFLAGCTTAAPLTPLPDHTSVTPTISTPTSSQSPIPQFPTPEPARPLPAPSREVTLDIAAARLGMTDSLAVDGTTVFLGMGTHLLTIDVRDPASPQVIAQSPEFPGIIHALVMRDHIAYVGAGVSIVTADVANPANVRIMGSTELSGVPLALALRGDVLYAGGTILTSSDPLLQLADHGGMVATLDIADVGRPQVLGTLILDDPIGELALAGNVLVANNTTVDVSDPTKLDTLQTRAFVPGMDAYASLNVFGGTLLVGHQHTLTGLDIRDPVHPQPKFETSLLDEAQAPTAFGYPVAVTVDGATATILAWYEGYESIGSLRLPQALSGSADYLASTRLVQAGSLLYLAQHGLSIFRAGHPLRAPIGVLQIDAPQDVLLGLGAAYVLADDSRFTVRQTRPEFVGSRGEIISLSLPDLNPLGEYAPKHVSELSTFSLIDGRIYLDEASAEGTFVETGLHVLDASNPASLRVLHTFGVADGLPINSILDMVRSPVVVNHHTIRAHVIGPDQIGYTAFDLDTPGSPPRVSTRYPLMTIEAANSRFVFATSAAPDGAGNLLTLINTSDWTISDKHVDIPGYIFNVAAKEDCALVGMQDGLALVSLRDPDNPHMVDEVALPDGAFEIALEGDRAFVTTIGDAAHGRLYVFTIQDNHLQLAASLDLLAGQAHVAAAPGWVIVGNLDMGVYLFKVS